MEKGADFHLLIQELTQLLNELPPGASWTVRQEVMGSLHRIAQLLANLEAERAELERMIAILEAEAIAAGRGGSD
jgi:hypothetical protein